MARTPQTLLDSACGLLAALRQKEPLVQCLTNTVVTNFTANALLALGASAAMADLPREAGPFAEIASGVLINLGTPGAEQREGMLEAAASAGAARTPWVLDPVAVGGLPVRTELAHQLKEQRPSIIRGNASEIMALAGVAAGGRGVDSTDSVEAALPAARELASSYGSVVAVSGPADLITDGAAVIRLANGTPLLTRVTGGGCALGAVIAAFADLGEDLLTTTASAVLVYTVASELAAQKAEGPGTFAPLFLDALANITEEQLRSLARIEVEA